MLWACNVLGLILVLILSGGSSSRNAVVVVVDGYPMEDLVVRLPGQPNVSFKQFAGYIDVDEKSGRSLFYYFVEAEGDQLKKKPLSLWLNGGPGCSSVGGGAFTELGPFFPSGDGRGLTINKKSWNKVSNLLFVESPAGVGWSYSNISSDYTAGDASTARDMHLFLMKWYEKFPEFKTRGLFLTGESYAVESPAGVGWSYSNISSDYTAGDASTARDMHLFLMKWYEKFPEFKTRDLFLTGESYAGHYIPQLANVLLDHNKYSKDFKFNIKGLALGNPLLNVDKDISSTFEFFWSHGMISDEIGLTMVKECNFEDYTFESPHNISKSCSQAISDANQIVGDYINNYDVILDVCYPDIVQQELRLRKMATKISVGVDVCMSYERRFYFNLPEVQRALHANRTNLPYGWTMCSDILKYSDTDGNINIIPILKRIIKHRIPVWVFSGDQDSVVPLLGSRTLVRELAEDLKFKPTVPYSAWYHKQQVGGWVTEYGNLLTFATVRGAAHMVPYSQPSRALHLFSSFVAGKRLPVTNRQPDDE